jgi:uncharacterized protein
MTTSESIPVTVAPNGNDKLWAIMAHISVFFSALLLPILVPLVIYLAMRNESRFVAEHAREALNFHLSLLIYVACCIPLIFVVIGIPLMILIGLASLVLGVIAAVKTSDGNTYRYPLTIRLVS